MDAKSQQKVAAAGFKIIRKDDQPKIRIKYKDKNHKEWATLINFETKAARDREYDRLMKLSDVIND